MNDRQGRRAADAALDAAAVTVDPVERVTLERLATRLLALASAAQRRRYVGPPCLESQVSRPALPIDRFLARCQRDPITGCLVYPVARDRYPQLWVNGRSTGMHRVALELHLAAKIGLPRPLPLPPRTMVLHRPGCVGKACVLGEHLRTGGGSENLKDAILAGHRPTKLGREAVRQIQSAPRTARARRDLAEALEVTTAHVRAVQRGRYWSWLP